MIVDDDYSDLPTLPPLNNYIFTLLPVFKWKRNHARLAQHLLKTYCFPAEDPNGAKVKTVQRDDVLNYARAKQYITEEELAACQAPGADVVKVLGDRYIEVFSKATVDVVMSIEVPARRAKAPDAEATNDVEMTIWLKDFPQTLDEYKALYALKQGVNGVFLVEEKFLPDEADDLSVPNMEGIEQGEPTEEEARRAEEKARTEYTAKERVALLRTALELPRQLRSGALGAEADSLLTVQRLKFKPLFDRPATPPSGDPPAEPDAAYEASMETQRGEDA